MSRPSELQGLINVKISSGIKTMNFLPWKAWKRQWVMVRRSTSSRNGVELVIGRNSHSVVQIFPEDIICRAESRTQYYAFGIFPERSKRARVYLSGISETESNKWMSIIRKLLRPPLLPVEDNEFSVSVIDNFFTRSLGFSGLYGTMRVTPQQVVLIDPCTSKCKVAWSWTDLSQFQVTSTTAEEDKGHVCTIITSRSYPGGVGPIRLFCSEGVALVGKLRSRGRSSSLVSTPEGKLSVPFRHHTFSCNFFEKPGRISPAQSLTNYNTTFRNLFLTRRLSRSEGNLLSVFPQADAKMHGFLDGRRNCLDPFHHETLGLHKSCFGSSEYFMEKVSVAPGIISAGLGLIFSTPGGSEGDSESLNEYLKLQNGDSEDELSSLSFINPSVKFAPPRRESGVSMASGVYEEIEELPVNTFDFEFEAENEPDRPPPLPPRRELAKNIQELGSRPTFNETLLTKPSSWGEECHYLPMLPGCGLSTSNSTADFPGESKEEQNYMVMTRLRTT